MRQSKGCPEHEWNTLGRHRFAGVILNIIDRQSVGSTCGQAADGENHAGYCVVVCSRRNRAGGEGVIPCSRRRCRVKELVEGHPKLESCTALDCPYFHDTRRSCVRRNRKARRGIRRTYWVRDGDFYLGIVVRDF